MPKKSAIMAIIGLFFLASLYAQEQGDPRQTMDSYLRFMPSQSVNALPGKVEIIEADSEYDYEFKLFEKLPVKFSMGNKYIGIENTSPVDLPAHLVGFATDLETTLPFFGMDKKYLRLGISPSFFGDEWNFSSSDFRMPFRAFLIHRPQDKLTFLLGVAVYPDFQRQVFPILGLIYKYNDRLVFNLVPKRPHISCILNEKVTLSLEGGSSFNNEFEVDKDNLKDVVLRYKESRLGTAVKYKFNRFIQASASSGWAFNRYLKYRDSLGKVNIKDAVYGEFRLVIEM